LPGDPEIVSKELEPSGSRFLQLSNCSNSEINAENLSITIYLFFVKNILQIFLFPEYCQKK
jgi:hypothetical protein